MKQIYVTVSAVTAPPLFLIGLFFTTWSFVRGGGPVTLLAMAFFLVCAIVSAKKLVQLIRGAVGGRQLPE